MNKISSETRYWGHMLNISFWRGDGAVWKDSLISKRILRWGLKIWYLYFQIQPLPNGSKSIPPPFPYPLGQATFGVVNYSADLFFSFWSLYLSVVFQNKSKVRIRSMKEYIGGRGLSGPQICIRKYMDGPQVVYCGLPYNGHIMYLRFGLHFYTNAWLLRLPA